MPEPKIDWRLIERHTVDILKSAGFEVLEARDTGDRLVDLQGDQYNLTEFAKDLAERLA